MSAQSGSLLLPGMQPQGWQVSQHQRKPLTEEQKAKLKAPLPPEAVKPHPTKDYLSTIKVIYVVERLNDVFGVNGWEVDDVVIEKAGKMVVVHSTLTVPEYGIRKSAFGGNDNSDLGDAYKGACTDALSKIGSYLYIGMDVYKGLADKPAAPSTQRAAPQPSTPRATPATTPRPASAAPAKVPPTTNLDAEPLRENEGPTPNPSECIEYLEFSKVDEKLGKSKAGKPMVTGLIVPKSGKDLFWCTNVALHSTLLASEGNGRKCKGVWVNKGFIIYSLVDEAK